MFIRRWNKPGVEVCVHAFVARDEVIQTLPWNWRGWHAGSGKNGSANNTHISFECCEPAGHTYQNGKMVGYDVEKNEAYFQDIYRNAVELSAMLCRQYRLDPMEPGVILDHAGGHALGIASNHSDVGQWWPLHGKTMDDFRRAVRDAMRGGEETVTQEQFDAMMADYLARRGREKPLTGLRTPAAGRRRPDWSPGTALGCAIGTSPPGRRPSSSFTATSR